MKLLNIRFVTFTLLIITILISGCEKSINIISVNDCQEALLFDYNIISSKCKLCADGLFDEVCDCICYPLKCGKKSCELDIYNLKRFYLIK